MSIVVTANPDSLAQHDSRMHAAGVYSGGNLDLFLGNCDSRSKTLAVRSVE